MLCTAARSIRSRSGTSTSGNAAYCSTVRAGKEPSPPTPLPVRGRGEVALTLGPSPCIGREETSYSPSPLEGEGGALARGAVSLDVAHVVDDQDGRDEQAHRHRGGDGRAADRASLHVVGTGDGDESEEDEDEDVAQPVVAQRPGAAGVEDGRGDGGQTDHHDGQP